ncbi:MAG: transglutaminase-like domain-containing protein [Candidatus Faecousia sp.]|nr:transglutaminase-like domain-containing protein [Candidatus Faecousia sp.]
MMKRRLIPAMALCLLLTGCGWFNGSYVSITPHQEQKQTSHAESITASNYRELLEALKQIIASGTEVAAIHVEDYPENTLEDGIRRAAKVAMRNDPIGAYAVENIQYEIGSSSGLPAVSVTVTYRHNSTELQRIRRAANMEQSCAIVANVLESYESSIVMLVDAYAEFDFSQYVQDYASVHPDTVMETPQVTEAVYGTGDSRIVELIFSYQTSRDALRRMQAQVEPVFDSAVLYVSGDGDDHQKYAQLYAFLMERFDYKQETSLTPAYSLLRHGIGDSRAFAQVYAAMCRDAGLACMSITGTRDGEPWTWNMILDNGQYYHVDLLRCSESGKYREQTDEEMGGYVWDYSAYPACDGETVVQSTEFPETVPGEKNGAFEK